MRGELQRMHMKMHWKLKAGIITGVVLTALLVFGIVDKLYCNSVPAHSAGGVLLHECR